MEIAETGPVDPIFDAVLIDEAQDLPPEFFQLVYLFTREPKRIAWGYDELQKLSEAAMPGTDELFGVGPNGESRVSLETPPESPTRDVVLPVCYRNTPWALATAHSLGIGVYRDGGLLQHPDEAKLWTDIGYNTVSGRLEEGSPVVLERSRTSYPQYFPELLDPGDAVAFQEFGSLADQDAWVASEIARNLAEDELDHDDILVVLPDSYKAKSRAPSIMMALRRHGIPSHLVGVNSSVDEVFQPGSVALAHIFRAKGNEAPMVYVVDAQHGGVMSNEVTRRNTLFTAITRSRAWVRITGVGQNVEAIRREIDAVFANHFKLEFEVPTQEELQTLRHIHRDRSPEQRRSLENAARSLTKFLEAFERGELELEDLPAELRERLEQLGGVPNGEG